VTTSADINTFTSTSSAMPPSLSTSFDSEGRRRFSAGLLQQARKENDDAESLPQIHRLGVGSPNMSKVDPALYGKDNALAQSVIDPALDKGSDRAKLANEREDPDWLTKVRVLEEIRTFIRLRIDNKIYHDEDDNMSRSEGDLERENESLYPSIRSSDE
jgi:hypothetical protein